jgi:gliding motility-associated-like protein
VLKPSSPKFLISGILLLIGGTLSAQSDQFATRGREFWLGFMQNASGTQQLSLKIASATATSGTVDLPLAGWTSSFVIPANGVATVVVPNSYEVVGSETITDLAVHVTASDPVTVSAINYQNQTTDASQVLPMESLGTTYRVEALPGTNVSFPNGTYMFRSEFIVVATEDGTTVEITPTATTTAGRPAGIPFTVSLNAGQTYQVQALNGTADLTGTFIRSTAESGPCRPFAVFGGSMCAVVGCAACDHVNEQMIPVNAWGTSFRTVPLGNTLVHGYRVQAGEDNTSVTIDGGAPILLNAGEAHQVLGNSQPVCIVGDRPISVTEIMEGMTCAGSGDPSLLILEPDDRMSTSSVFSTFPSTQAGIMHYVSLITPTGSTAMMQLDGVPVPGAFFNTYSACAGFSYAKIAVSPGTHRLSSSAGFIAYAYGLATGESYLYSISNTFAPPVQQDTLICSNGPVTLTAPVALTNALWTAASDPSTVLATGMGYSFTPDHNDIYRVDGELSPSGCPKHFEFHVGLPIDPQLDLVANGGPSAEVCRYNAVQLGMDEVLDPQWFDLHWTPSSDLSDPDIADPVAYPSADTWYKLLVTSPIGCGTALDSVFVTVHPTTIYGLRTTVADDSICAGGTTTLHAQVEHVVRVDAFEGGAASWWSDMEGGALSALCGSVSGTALYFNGPGSRIAATGPLDLSAGGMAHFALKIASGSAPCDDAEPGEDVVLESSLDGSVWTVLRTFSENGYPVFAQVDVLIPALGASGTNARLRWRQLSNSGAGQDNWAIDNVLVTAYEDAPSSLVWSPTAGLSAPTSALTSAEPAEDTWYKGMVTNSYGCTYSDSVRVTVAPTFHILPINDTTRCGPDGTQLLAQIGSGSTATWSWSPADGSLDATDIPSPVASPITSTTYTVTATNAIGCTDVSHVSVAVTGLTSVVSQVSDPTLCHGEQVDLSAAIVSTAPYSISWSPAQDINLPDAANTSAAPEDTTTFVCTVTDTPSGCSMSSAVTVNVNPSYSVHLRNDTTVCTALGMQLGVQHNVAAPYQVAWTPAMNLNAANIAAPTILVDTTATYVVTITDPSGCSATDSMTIAVAFDNLMTPVTLSACEGETLLLDAGYPGSTYEWTTDESTQTINVSVAGTYTATITDADQCQAIKTFNAAFAPLPAVDLGPDMALCGETDHVIDASNAGNNVLWSTGATTNQLDVSTTGTYSVTVTTPQGCQAGDAVHISLDPLPQDLLEDIAVCADSPPTLDAGNAGSTYQWSTSDTTQTIVPLTSGTYAVTITTPANCSAIFDAHVDLMPLIAVDLGPDTSLCAGQPLTLDPGAVTGDLLWNNGATTPTLPISNSGTYSVHVTNGFCSAADTIAVLFHALPLDQLTDVTSCIDAPVILDAGNAGSTYAWSNGAQSQSITIGSPGSYAVTITSADGCSSVYGADVAFVDPPSMDLGADTVLCEGEVLDLDAQLPGCTYLWSTGATVGHIQVTHSGTYSVSLDNGYCVTTDSIRAIFNPLPSPLGTHQYFTCLDEEPHHVAIDAANSGGVFEWSNGGSTQIAHVADYGVIAVNITNAFGCTLTDSALIIQACQPTIFIPNTFTPNGDGRNDVWLPVANNVASYEVHVFDRWGNVIFHSTSVDQGWDGTINGDPAPNEIYAWRATYRLMDQTSGAAQFEQTKLGHIQVLR